jgi:exodeoxyribonuclease X
MPIIRIFDVETTGIEPKEHRVVEIAAFDLHANNRIERVGAYLVNPGRVIPPEASAVHHLIDADVAGAHPFDNVWARYLANAPVVYAAHNCAFEQSYIPTPEGTQWICTHKSSLRVWPDAPGHSNQVLRYWLGLGGKVGFDRQLASPAHRAEPDAYVTAWVLSMLLGATSFENLITWTKEPKVYPRMTFGKHRGQKWSDVPVDYLQWMCNQRDMDTDWQYGAKLELERRSTQP